MVWPRTGRLPSTAWACLALLAPGVLAPACDNGDNHSAAATSAGHGGAAGAGTTTAASAPPSAGGGGEASVCGDGHLATGERCDDGNLSADDGCAPDCLIEPGWTCRGEQGSECLPLWTVDLVPWIAQAVTAAPGAGSQAFVVPQPIELTAFAVAADVLIHDDWSAASAAAAPIGYRAVVLDDLGAPHASLLALVPDSWTALQPAGGAGRGAYILRTAAVGTDLVLEAPHPKHDAHTAMVAAMAFRQLSAQALAVASAHRCANQAPSLCSGTTSACSGDDKPYRESDMAHTPEAFFQVFHQAIDTLLPSTIVQVHGMSSAGSQPIASVSDGTTANVVSEQHPSNRLAANISMLVLAADGAKLATSCNRTGDPNLLCGSTNTQGRFSNGVAPSAVCTSNSGGVASGRFIHIELGPQLRSPRRAPGPQLFINALARSFP